MQGYHAQTKRIGSSKQKNKPAVCFYSLRFLRISTQDKTMINPISPKRYTSVDPKQTKREAGSKRAQHSQGKEDKWKRKKILRPKAAAADKEETKRRQRGDKGEKKGETNRRR